MKKALLVGINDYTREKDLRGCVNDVREMAELLDLLGYDSIRTLVDRQARKDRVISSLRELLSAEDGETDGARLFFFAGHGGRVFDSPGGDEGPGDGIDENLCFPSYRPIDRESYLLDDELGAILDRAAADAPFLRNYVVLDSCHSGTATRGSDAPDASWDSIADLMQAQFGIRDPLCVPWSAGDTRLALCSVPRRSTDPEGLEERLTTMGAPTASGEPRNHLLFSGCSAAQTCKDVPLDGSYHGIFTYTITRLVKGQTGLRWSDVHSAARAVIADDFMQHPQLEGPEGLKALQIFA